MKTSLPKESEIQRSWYIVDAAGKPLGRMAVKIANLLRGRDKATFTNHIDTGNFVVVINAKDVKLTGSKDSKKLYERYTGFRSGHKTTTVAMMRERHPDRIISKAVEGMLPGNHMSLKIIKRLKVFAGAEHTHAAQNPKVVELK
ncbi:MAG: 50S ribosomal protein L13 [bacterium]